MALTNLNWAIAMGLCAVAAIAAIVIQSKQVSTLRAENQRLTAETGRIHESHADGVSRDQGGAFEELERLRREAAEVYRLRGEVAQLRRDRAESVRLVEENARLRQQVQQVNSVNMTAPADRASDPADKGELLPLVVFEDVPFVDAIRTLARAANLKVVFDPHVAALGSDGTPAYPPVSLRLENVTVKAVLEAVLNNNNLQLELDPGTELWRVAIKQSAASDHLR